MTITSGCCTEQGYDCCMYRSTFGTKHVVYVNEATF